MGISSLEQEACQQGLKLGELSQCPSTRRGETEPREAGNAPRPAPAFFKPLSILETPLNDQGGDFKSFYP